MEKSILSKYEIVILFRVISIFYLKHRAYSSGALFGIVAFLFFDPVA